MAYIGSRKISGAWSWQGDHFSENTVGIIVVTKIYLLKMRPHIIIIKVKTHHHTTLSNPVPDHNPDKMVGSRRPGTHDTEDILAPHTSLYWEQILQLLVECGMIPQVGIFFV